MMAFCFCPPPLFSFFAPAARPPFFLCYRFFNFLLSFSTHTHARAARAQLLSLSSSHWGGKAKKHYIKKRR